MRHPLIVSSDSSDHSSQDGFVVRDWFSRHRTAATPRPRFKLGGRTYYSLVLADREREQAHAAAYESECRKKEYIASLRCEA